MNKKNIIYFILGILIGAGLTYYGFISYESLGNEVNKVKTEEEYEEAQNYVNISEKTMEEFGIKIKTAGPDKIVLHKDLTGEIIPNPYSVAHIVPRFKGVVIDIYKEIGDRVKKGEKIATIESNESLVRYDVTSSINGTIIAMHMTPGELIGDEKHIVTVANLNSVWAELNIYQQDLSEIKIGQKAEIFSPTHEVYTGKLFYISPVIDEATRTAVTRVKVQNRNGIWKPGMFVTAKVYTSAKIVNVAVPKDAVQNLNGEKVIFVKTEKGFTPRVVSLGIENGKNVEVLSGLHAGDIYVAKGAFIFKSELLKESFGGEEE